MQRGFCVAKKVSKAGRYLLHHITGLCYAFGKNTSGQSIHITYPSQSNRLKTLPRRDKLPLLTTKILLAMAACMRNRVINIMVSTKYHLVKKVNYKEFHLRVPPGNDAGLLANRVRFCQHQSYMCIIFNCQVQAETIIKDVSNDENGYIYLELQVNVQDLPQGELSMLSYEHIERNEVTLWPDTTCTGYEFRISQFREHCLTSLLQNNDSNKKVVGALLGEYILPIHYGIGELIPELVAKLSQEH